MTASKSLKKLRSASVAFLEDGGTLLNGVDGLIRDVTRLLRELDDREHDLTSQEDDFRLRSLQLDEREARLEKVEKHLLEMTEAWKATVAVQHADSIDETIAQREVVTEIPTEPVMSEPAIQENVEEALAEEEVATAVDEIQEALGASLDHEEDVSAAPSTPALRPLPSMLSAARHRRRKRRRP